MANTIGSLISATTKHVTFALDSTGGCISTFRHDDFNKRLTFNNEFCQTHAHNGPITDIQYNLFEPTILASCGFDAQIQLWLVNEDVESSSIKLDNLSTIRLNENRSDCCLWNPNVDKILLSSSLNTIYLWDVEHSTSKASSKFKQNILFRNTSNLYLN